MCWTYKDKLGKFYPKSDEAIFLGYSSTSKAYRVYNKRTLLVEESIHVKFVEIDEEEPNLGEDDILEIIQNIDKTHINEIEFKSKNPLKNHL